MKRVVVAAGFLVSLALASNSYADPSYGSVDLLLNGYDVGTECGVLTFPKCEEAKIYDDGDYTDLVQIDTTGASWTQIGTNIYAFDLSKFGFDSAITTFAVKIGNGGAPATGDDFFVFKNIDSLDYAVINLSTLSTLAGKTLNIDSISHIATVPEPGTLLLTGLLGLGLASARRRFHSARHA